jgi:hypothetical protein
MVEFHVDDFKQMDDANWLGRNLSIHFPSHVKPLLLLLLLGMMNVSLSSTVSQKNIGFHHAEHGY